MTNILNLVLAALLFFAGSITHAETEDDTKKFVERVRQRYVLGLDLAWKPTLRDTLDKRMRLFDQKPFCHDGRVGLWWNATHPGGDQGGALNERTRGVYFECPFVSYMDGHVKTIFKTGGVFNSQFGDTFLAGFGVRAETSEYYFVTLGIGGELHYIRYEHPRRDRVLVGFLPVGTLDFTVRIPGWCKFTFIEHHLAETGAKLYGRKFLCERKFY